MSSSDGNSGESSSSGIHEIKGLQQLESYIKQGKQEGKLVVADCTASWCGPCQAIAPVYEQLAKTYPDVLFLKVSEGEEGNKEVLMEYSVRAFPTFLFFVSGEKRDEVKGADPNALKQKIESLQSEIFRPFGGEGQSLGAPSENVDPREARLRRLGAGSASGQSSASSSANTQGNIPASSTSQTPQDACKLGDPNCMSSEGSQLQQSLLEMGFELEMVQEAIKATKASSLDEAVEWIAQKQEETENGETTQTDSANRPAQGNVVASVTSDTATGEATSAQAPDETSAPVSTTENTEDGKNLSPEEKVRRAEELIKKKRREKEEQEKRDEIEREKKRREQGKEMSKVKETYEEKQRRRDIEEREKEKRMKAEEREQIRKRLAQDQLEKLAEQYGGVDKIPEERKNPIMERLQGSSASAKSKLSQGTPEERIKKAVNLTKEFRAGGDGLRALKIMRVLINNPLTNPEEPKYEKINLDNEKIKTRLVKLKTPITALEATGFKRQNEENTMVLHREEGTNDRMKYALEQIDNAIQECN
eukprot:gb/GECG01014723.1/.p1 GENE.gb/GECG01014723.1/~~gb/GECG01014723.1/.p1  ORF type:complete len:534 (+),score=120.65 gb/GECG01014723.1/:1-1602(+)